jgi:hypothetical protein
MPLERTPKLTVNGINRVTGQYDVKPLSSADLAARLRRSHDSGSISPANRPRTTPEDAAFQRSTCVRPEDVRQSGWTLVFHRDENIEVRRSSPCSNIGSPRLKRKSSR